MKRKLHILYCITMLGFLIGIHDGRIALWKDGDPEPVKVFPYQVSMLPEEDRALLEKGIYCEDAGELAKYMEDYLS